MIARVVPFESFRAEIEAAVLKPVTEKRSSAGRIHRLRARASLRDRGRVFSKNVVAIEWRALMMWRFHFRHVDKRVGIVIIEAPIVVCAPDRPSRQSREMLSSSILHP